MESYHHHTNNNDNRGNIASTSSNPGAFAAHLVSLRHGTFTKLTQYSEDNNESKHQSNRMGGGDGSRGNMQMPWLRYLYRE